MRSLSSLGICLSVIFGCLFLALVAEFYYLFCWKKRIKSRDIEEEEDYSAITSAREFYYLFCWKQQKQKPVLNPQELESQTQQLHLHSTSNIDFLLKPFGEETVESELMRLHNLSGPPRFLFTIKEETREDLESEDGNVSKSKKGSRARSLSDVMLQMETPFFTPLSSPPFCTPMESYYSNLGFGFNPLFESSSDVDEISRRVVLKSDSPPSKFKFLQDAEEKLYRRTVMLMEEAEKVDHGSVVCPSTTSSSMVTGKDEQDGDGSFITILVGKNKPISTQVVRDQHYLYRSQNYHTSSSSSSSQVLPLAISPSEIRPVVSMR